MTVKIFSIIIGVILLLGGIQFYAMHREAKNLADRVAGCSKELGEINAKAERYRLDAFDALAAASAATGAADDRLEEIRRLRDARDGDVAPVLSDTLRLLDQLQLDTAAATR